MEILLKHVFVFLVPQFVDTQSAKHYLRLDLERFIVPWLTPSSDLIQFVKIAIYGEKKLSIESWFWISGLCSKSESIQVARSAVKCTKSILLQAKQYPKLFCDLCLAKVALAVPPGSGLRLDSKPVMKNGRGRLLVTHWLHLEGIHGQWPLQCKVRLPAAYIILYKV